jgi:hypothetical protein
MKAGEEGIKPQEEERKFMRVERANGVWGK